MDYCLNTAPITLERAIMSIKGSGSTDLSYSLLLAGDVNLDSNRDDLPVGVYTVQFDFEGKDTDDNDFVLVWNELMYVYATLTSTFSETFTSAYFYRENWNVTYNHNYGATPETSKQSVVHGGTLTDPNPTRSGYTLVGWYTKDGTGDDWGDKWNFTDPGVPVHEDMTLYAQWQLIVGTATVSVDVETIAVAFTITTNPGLSPGSVITVSRDSTAATHEVDVTVAGLSINGTAVTLGNYTFSWLVPGVGTYSDETGTGTSFKLSGANTAYNTLGGHVLRLTATPTAGGDSYQHNILFTITN